LKTLVSFEAGKYTTNDLSTVSFGKEAVLKKFSAKNLLNTCICFKFDREQNEQSQNLIKEKIF